MKGVAVALPRGDHRNAVTELHQAIRSCLVIIADGDPAAPEGVAMRKGKTHCPGTLTGLGPPRCQRQQNGGKRAVIGTNNQDYADIMACRTPCSPAAEYIGLSARFALDHGLHTVVEGILLDDIYGDALRNLIENHRGKTRCYRYVLPFEETVKRHATKPNAGSFGEFEMRQRWRDADPLTGIAETIIGPEQALTDSVARVLAGCGWPPPAPLVSAG